LKTINLTVPFFSQRDNNYIWHYKREKDEEIKKKTLKKGSPVTDSAGNEITSKIWDGCCNITCLAMVLNYLGVTQDTPYKMCQKIFADDYPSNSLKHADFDRYIKYRKDSNVAASKGYECIENAGILKRIATDIYNVRNVYTSSSTYTIDDIKKEIEAGYPVIVSCGITRPSSKWLENEMKNNTNPSDSTKSAYNALQKDVNYEYHGHYIVVRGFTKEGNVIINDPWGKATNNAGRIPNELIENAPQDAWGYYSANIYDGTNKGENIIITKSDFERQYHGKFWSVLIIYDRRWSFPFKNHLTNFIKVNQGTYKKYIPDNEQIEACYKLQVPGIYFPITSTCTPHNGIHINAGKHTNFYSIGSGMLVAAKLCNKKNEVIENGSNCFILVKHQVQMPKQTKNAPVDIRTFFCLYNHIRPISFTNEDIANIRFLTELNTEINKDKEKKFFDEQVTSRKTNILQNEAKELLDKLKAGETVIFNEGRIISEVAEGDYLGQTDSKGFDAKTVKNGMHWEIFSNVNFFSDKSKFSEYDFIDFSNISYYNREEVISNCRNHLFNSFNSDKNYTKYTKHLNKNAIGIEGIEKFYSTDYSHKARVIVLHNKTEWDSNRDFPKEYNDSNQKGYTPIKEDLSDFNNKYVKPFLWWDANVDKAINKDLINTINNKSPFYYDPINFLIWLMKNDDELYKQICPNSYNNEFN
jgi:hypothetical protein